MTVDDSALVEKAIEGILIGGACIVGNFYSAGLAG
jgi:hypothetical protein